MRSKQLTEILIQYELTTDAKARNVNGALTKAGYIDGRKDLEPFTAAWQIFANLAIPSANFQAATAWAESMMWLKDRRHEHALYNEIKDTPIFALMAYLAKPNLVDEYKVQFFGFAPDGRLFIFREGAGDILPKKLIGEDGSVWDAKDKPVLKGALIPAGIIQDIARQLGFTDADIKAESNLLIDILE